ncbi:MAG: IclR family transcriptional regulator [Desulfotignum sp.]|nr:IclR family transcriptional regulator [Desulfotignum sp.]MCF8126612.1 IclR family transcriptional regulator [Desulfotignum sp.]
MNKRYQAPIVKKAFDILKAISKSEKGLRISDIATDLDISKSTVHGITAALEEQGAIIRHPDSKRYTIGLTLMELGKAAYERVDIIKLARPAMENLMEQCGESVFLGIRNAHHVTVIDIVESRKDFKISSPIGTALPLLAGAVGKVFLSAMPRAEAAAYLKTHPLPRFTSRTIVDPAAYMEELKIVKTRGYALDDEEYLAGVRAVAVCLAPREGYLPALWVVGFKAGMSDDQMPAIIDQALTAARQINQVLS